LGALVLAALTGAGCTNSDTRAVRTPSALTGSLTVSAAASLTDVFTDVEAPLERSHSGLTLTFNFAGSQALVQQVIGGAPVDVIATADTRSMDKLASANLVEAPVVLARNTLVIVVAPGNPKHISALADLARPGVAVVLADPSVPVGAYSTAVLAHAHAAVKPRSLELDVKAVLAKVLVGEADAGIVYATDATSAGTKAEAVAIEPADNQTAQYPIAVVRSSKRVAAGRALVQQLTGAVGRRALAARGFLMP
jgi:molybdate transport system substrate-binding protein